MNIEQWWPKLTPATRDWLIENNGDEVPAGIVAEIEDAGGPVNSEAMWADDDSGAPGFYFADAVVDWIDAVANDEQPQE